MVKYIVHKRFIIFENNYVRCLSVLKNSRGHIYDEKRPTERKEKKRRTWPTVN